MICRSSSTCSCSSATLVSSGEDSLLSFDLLAAELAPVTSPLSLAFFLSVVARQDTANTSTTSPVKILFITMLLRLGFSKNMIRTEWDNWPGHQDVIRRAL
jgi:hypothetical protein